MSADRLHVAATALLTRWSAPDDEQDHLREVLLAHLDAHPDAMWRSCRDGHLTGSALVVDHGWERVLFTRHPRLGRWVQMGGHCEPGDLTMAEVAHREATEESGITGLVLHSGPVDIDIHAFDCPKGHPNRHLDVRFIVVAPEGAREVISDESLELGWFPLDDPRAELDASTHRLVQRAMDLRPAAEPGGIR